MSPGSATAFLLWAILAWLFLAFLCIHLWGYDKFRCLRLNGGQQPGMFKRFMTWCYVLTTPLLVIYSCAIAYLKFAEGYLILGDDVYPKPTLLWSAQHKRWILPLNIVLSFIWVFEFTTHLEELTFWLFLIHTGPRPRDWFKSWEFTLWKYGTFIAVLAFPTTTLITRDDVLLSDAYLFAIGSSAALAMTLGFLPVLFRFPRFLRTVKDGGAGGEAVGRLLSFWKMNLVRVFFRFMFTLPLLIVSLDAIRGADAITAFLGASTVIPLVSPSSHSPLPNTFNSTLSNSTAHDRQSGFDPVGKFQREHPVLGHPFLADFMILLGGIGCFVSSGITLRIFFPWDNSATQSAPAMAAAQVQTSNMGQGHDRPYTSGLYYDDIEQDMVGEPSPRYPGFQPNVPDQTRSVPEHDIPAWDGDEAGKYEGPILRRHSSASVVLAEPYLVRLDTAEPSVERTSPISDNAPRPGPSPRQMHHSDSLSPGSTSGHGYSSSSGSSGRPLLPPSPEAVRVPSAPAWRARRIRGSVDVSPHTALTTGIGGAPFMHPTPRMSTGWDREVEQRRSGESRSSQEGRGGFGYVASFTSPIDLSDTPEEGVLAARREAG